MTDPARRSKAHTATVAGNGLDVTLARPAAANAAAAPAARRVRTASRAASPATDDHTPSHIPDRIPPGRHYWIGVVARDHVVRGVAGGFAQLNHGKAGALERMRAGDGFAYYSPREAHPDGSPLQAFTAIGRIRDGRVYQADAGGGFRPFRLDVAYFPARDAPIKPLLEALSFIRSKQHWGATFRFGIVRVPQEDFARVAAAMGCDIAAHFTFDSPADVAAASAGEYPPIPIPARTPAIGST